MNRAQRRHPPEPEKPVPAPQELPGREDMRGNVVPITTVHTQITRHLTTATQLINDIFDNLYAMERRINVLTAEIAKLKEKPNG